MDNNASQAPQPKKSKTRRRLAVAAGLLVLTSLLGWLALRPGIFVTQPIGAVPDGSTIIYLHRGERMPFIASADGLCLEMNGGVSLLCRGMVLGKVAKSIDDSIVVRLPYVEWMYLQSTGGQEFAR